MTDLFRLVYTSRNLLGGEGDEQKLTVGRIVEASRRNNARAGVTGALLFSAGSFAQILEGPRAAVEATFERIQRDSRHGDVSVLQCDIVAARIFSDWSMAFIGRSARGRALWDGLALSTGFDLERVQSDALCAALVAMVRAEEDETATPTTRAAGLDVERLRTALDAELPHRRAAPAAASRAAQAEPESAHVPAAAAQATTVSKPDAGTDAEDCVLRAALDEERGRTTALRRELDDARIALERASGEIEGLARHRDIWADRSTQLRGELKEVREASGIAVTERDALRARFATLDGELDTLRLQRDVWAERTRTLATALCRDPVVEWDEALPAGNRRPAAERARTPIVKVAG